MKDKKMLLNFTEVTTGDNVAVNPTAVITVFLAPQGEYKGKTVLALGQQPIIVNEDFDDVVAKINAAL
jgi:hypothetical protein